MISKLTGTLDTVLSDGAIIDVNGVGYFVHASAKTLAQLPKIGDKISFMIEHIIRQDHQQLCGFYEENERTCFRLLLGVQGVGVKVALAILSVLTPDELLRAIVHQDKTSLTRAEGVGPKVAGRIVLELKDKKLDFVQNSAQYLPEKSSSIQDALSGLMGLGYSKSEAAGALSKTIQNAGTEASAATLIKLALQNLASKG
jgi:Holliday junction DNA helicase RuvA